MKDMFMVNQPMLSVYKAPSMTAERIDELLYGMWGQLTGERKHGFVRICTGYGYEGWCRPEGLRDDEWDVCRVWCSNRGFIQSRFADVLSMPSIRAPLIVTLPKGSLVTVCGQEVDGWQSVELLGRIRGYVRCSQISPMRTGKRACFWQCGPVRCFPEEENGLRRKLVETAMEYLGTPYRWGGKSPEGIDCSGLCSLVYWLNGIVIYRDSRILPEYAVREIPAEEMQPGDLLYFPGHMALYVGDGRFIHSSFSKGGVVMGSLYPEDKRYSPELAGQLRQVGSIFDFQKA